VDILAFLKQLVKKLGIYQTLERWASNTYVGANIFLAFMNIRARKNGLDLRLEKTDLGLNILILKANSLIKISVRHFAYLQDVIDNFDHYFNAVKPDVLDDHFVVDYSTPRQHALMPSGVLFFFSSFAEPLETTNIYLQKGNLKDGDVVLDLGSYCGSTVWSFSRAVGRNGKVYGFEPDPVNYDVLCKNIKYHKLSNVIAFNKGVWSVSGNLLFQGEGNMGSGISSVQSRAANLLNVQVISLSDFCSEFNIDRIDYIKMDIEGAEVEVLKASGDVLKKYKPRLIIEPHMVGVRLVTDDICKILSEYGYNTEILVQADLPLPLIYAYPPSSREQ
jgi:FkbM family methyltransferase